MSKRLLFIADWDDDQGKHHYPRRMSDQASSLFAGHHVRWTAEISDHKRSRKQNAYWRGVILPYAMMGIRDAGYWDIRPNSKIDTQEIHYWLVEKIWGERSRMITDPDTGEIVVEILSENPSSSDKTVLDFTEIITIAHVWLAVHLSVVVPAKKHKADAGTLEYIR